MKVKRDLDHNSMRSEAAYWATLLDQRPLTDAEQKEFHDWLRVPDNRHAFKRYRALLSTCTEKEKIEIWSRNTFAPRGVRLPPGYRLTAVARFLLPEALFKRYVWPTIADMQWEYIEALSAGHVWQARWIAMRGHLLVIPPWVYAFLAGKIHALFGSGK